MKKYCAFLLALSIGFFSLSQEVKAIENSSTEIRDNLDLEAVSSIFGDSKDIEDFERKLNDPDLEISNLDLNKDGDVDYLRVIEAQEDETHILTIQSVIGKNEFQNVAVIDVEKKSESETTIQVVGDEYIYGPNYIIEPVYQTPPVVVVVIFKPHHHHYHSPYHYGHYPPHFHHRHPHTYATYHAKVKVHKHHSYHHVTVRKSSTSVKLQSKNRKNDYGTKNPNNSYSKKHQTKSPSPQKKKGTSTAKKKNPQTKTKPSTVKRKSPSTTQQRNSTKPRPSQPKNKPNGSKGKRKRR